MINSKNLPSAGEIADWLDHVGRCKGDGRFAHAAGIIRGRAGGRRAIDDSILIETVFMMVEDGTATSIESAAKHVASRVAQSHSETATARRLARKCRAQASPTNLIKCLDRAPSRK